MEKIYVRAQAIKAFRNGTARSRAWFLLQAFDGLSVEEFVKGCSLMERASGIGGDPEGWVKFFTAEKLAEVRLESVPLTQFLNWPDLGCYSMLFACSNFTHKPGFSTRRWLT